MTKAFIYFFVLLTVFSSCGSKKTKYKIGISQCSEDVWRNKQNAELEMESNFHEDVTLCFVTAYDDSRRQIQQIDSLVASGIDLLIVAPNQTESISEAIDRTAEKNIPVIVFERKTDSEKYTAFMSADNYEMGFQMARYIASLLSGKGRVLEVKGLPGSSPAAERHEGFVNALKDFPEIEIAASVEGDWTQEKAYTEVKQILPQLENIDLVFGHNDRSALGARKAFEESSNIKKLPKFCGIDGLPGKNGGIKLVRDSLLDASYIYPTCGDKLLILALDILEGRQYQKETLLSSAIVTPENASVLYMSSEEIISQRNHLEILRNKAENYLQDLTNQKFITILAACVVILLLVMLVVVYKYWLEKNRINLEREKMAQQQLEFYTEISHQLRTPLTLIEGPLSTLNATDEIKKLSPENSEMFTVLCRNTSRLSELINRLLEKQSGKHSGGLSFSEIDALTVKTAAQETVPVKTLENTFTLLIVDDNADILAYLRRILSPYYNVLEASDGNIGLQTAEKEVPDLIISDIMMPVMDGLEFCRRAKENIITSHIPVILLTARSLDENFVEGFKSGADAYITKPFSEDLLLARIDNLLKNRHLLKNIWEKVSEPQPQPKAAEEVEKPTEVEDAFIQRFKAYVDKKLSDSELSVETIAADLGLSRVQLYRKIKALTGCTPVDLLRKARLNAAMNLLKKGTMSISEIAYSVGFTAPSYFTKCFKDEYGMPPGEV
ncbi:MAG: substrate-binding domain-containing protein [Bacteroidales bacterium]|nr:substrate-binding domain-containing protein [Bacteroidales bacterium]